MSTYSSRYLSSDGMKKLSLDLIDYSEDFKKLKSDLCNLETKIKKSFCGDLSNRYINKLDDFLNNLDYISEDIKRNSEYCNQVIIAYDKNDKINLNVNFINKK